MNPELIALVEKLSKRAFTDPAALGGAAPMDPAQAAAMQGGQGPTGAPPAGDPAAGGDPNAAPADPAAGGGGDQMGAIMAALGQMQQQIMALQQGGGAAAGGAGAGGAGAAAGGIKPKIDVNTEIMQIKHMMAKICDALGIQLSAAEMVATPDKLNQMAAQQQAPAGEPAAQSAIQPVQPMGAASPQLAQPKAAADNGVAYSVDQSVTEKLNGFSKRASAISKILKAYHASEGHRLAG